MATMVGSVMESGIARAAGPHSGASLPGLPGPCSLVGPLRHRHEVVTRQRPRHEGWVAVPDGPGLGAEVDAEQPRRLDMRR